MFKKLIIDNQERIKELSFLRRDFIFETDILKLHKIVTFIWSRRAGKTYTMFQSLRDMIEKDIISLQDIIFIDFSESIEKNIDFNTIVENYYELFPHGTPFFIFDEIQEIQNFKEWVLSLFNRGYKIFLSGSNSNMLSSELSTQFRGRIYEYFIHPLSFSEFLRFRSFEIKENYSTKENGILKNLFREYSTYGWYPEITLVDNIVIKENLIKNYLNILIYKDLIERYRIENEYVIKYLIKSLILSNTKLINVTKIFNELKSQNVSVSKNTLYNYIEYLENIFFIKKLTNYYTPKGFYKVYLYDISYTFLYKNHTDYGKNFENIIFFSLQKLWWILYFKQGTKSGEIDFYQSEKGEDIQVCFELNGENFEREINPLVKSESSKKILITFEKYDRSVEWVEIRSFLDTIL